MKDIQGKDLMQEETVKEYRVRVARSGGNARAKNLTPAERTEVARKGSAARWEKVRKEAAEGQE